MGFKEWARQTREDIQRESTSYALKHALHELYIGGLRRVQQVLRTGTPHWDGDWDILVVCDACRADLFREFCEEGGYDWLPEPEQMETWWSAGSTSEEWMASMFDEQHLGEMQTTGYVSGNPFVTGFDTEAFGYFELVDPEWVSDVRTIDPAKITDLGIDVWRRREEHDIDRLILHYMQPHAPFRSRPEWFEMDLAERSPWGAGFLQLRDGKISRGEFWSAYLDNLHWVAEYVDLVVEHTEAEIVISADHGNGLGEWGVYGHPSHVPTASVREVPWVRVEGKSLPGYEPDLSWIEGGDTNQSHSIEEHLSALGYK
jgi:hypothetical protein